MMNAERLQQAELPWRVQCVEETSSTSDLIREAGLKGEPEGLVIFAEAQTAGRGQRSNAWVTPKGLDLMFSVLLRPQLPLVQWPRLTTVAALAMCKGIEDFLPLIPKIKWPNDIYLGPRKVCGLLAETFTGAEGSFLVLGIGMNVNTIAFAEELRGIATSLLQELPATIREVNRELLAATLLRELAAVLPLWGDDFHEAVAAVRKRSLLIGQSIRAKVNGQEMHGRVLDLNHEGHLVLAQADGSSLVLSSAAEVRML